MNLTIKRLIIVGLLVSSFKVNAQSWKHHHEITAGYGIATSYSLQRFNSSFSSQSNYDLSLADGKSQGAFFLSYHFYTSNRIAIGLGVNYEKIKGKTKDAFDNENGEGSKKTFGLVPELVVNYLNLPFIKLYGMIGFGVSYNVEKMRGQFGAMNGMEVTFLSFPYQATPIGIRAGKTLGLFLEAGYGYKGILNAGASLKL